MDGKRRHEIMLEALKAKTPECHIVISNDRLTMRIAVENGDGVDAIAYGSTQHKALLGKLRPTGAMQFTSKEEISIDSVAVGTTLTIATREVPAFYLKVASVTIEDKPITN